MRYAARSSRLHLFIGLLLSAQLMLGCKQAKLDAESVLATADSAAREAWATTSDRISTLHSSTYDSLSRYYHLAATIEADRISLEDSLDQFATRVLGSTEIEVDTIRANTEQRFRHFSRSLDSLDNIADSVRLACSAYFDRLITKGLKLVDRAALERTKAAVLQPARFVPIWRPYYDSLQTEASRLFLSMLGVFDSAQGAVIVDSSSGRVYRFRDLSLTSRFNAYRDSLARIGTLQSAARPRSSHSKQP